MLHNFNDQNFKEEVLNFKGVVLVDFGADYCASCRVMSLIVEELAKEEVNDQIKIGVMNTAENPQTPNEYGIMSIPSVIIFKKGKVAEQISGVRKKDDLKKLLEKVLE